MSTQENLFTMETVKEKLDDALASTLRGALAPGSRRAYCLAGHATFTIQSIVTRKWFTYRITLSDDGVVWFVKLLTGPENTADYRYIGIIGSDHRFHSTKKTPFHSDAPSMRAITWFCNNWEDHRVECWHEGRCGRCGHALTVPESIASGIGPTCAGYTRP